MLYVFHRQGEANEEGRHEFVQEGISEGSRKKSVKSVMEFSEAIRILRDIFGVDEEILKKWKNSMRRTYSSRSSRRPKIRTARRRGTDPSDQNIDLLFGIRYGFGQSDYRCGMENVQ